MTLGRVEVKTPYHRWGQLLPWKKNLIFVCVAQGIVTWGWTFMSPLYPLFIQEELGIGDPKEAAFWAGLTSGILALVMGAFGPFWGYLADRYGRKPILMRAYLGGAATLLLSGMVTNVYQLIGVRILHGSMSGSVGSAMALAAAVVPKNRVPLAVGMLQFSNFFAITVGPLVGIVVANAFGFRITYFIASGIVASSVLIILFLVKEDFQRPEETKGKGFAFLSETREVLASKGILPALIVITVVQSAPMIMQPVVPGFIQLITENDNTITGAGLAFALLGLMSGVSALFIGKFSERLALRSVLIFSCFGAALAFLPQLFVHSYLVFVILFAVFGIFSGGMLTSIHSMVGMLIPKQHLGAAFGVVNSANALAWGLGPLVGGSLAWTIGIRQVFPAAAIYLGVTGVAVAGIFKGVRAPAPTQPRPATSQEGGTGDGGS